MFSEGVGAFSEGVQQLGVFSEGVGTFSVRFNSWGV